MSQFAPAYLTIHILTAIVAFGPGFAIPLISALAGKEPQHGSFAVRLVDLMERRLVLPVALTMPVSGALLIWSEGIDLRGTHWLLAGITLYVVAIVFAFTVQLRTIDRMLDVAGRMAAGAATAVAGAGRGATAAAAFRPTSSCPTDPVRNSQHRRPAARLRVALGPKWSPSEFARATAEYSRACWSSRS
jgi:uncharacterized membrane protein